VGGGGKRTEVLQMRHMMWLDCSTFSSCARLCSSSTLWRRPRESSASCLRLTCLSQMLPLAA
jgi:hypothetical protein